MADALFMAQNAAFPTTAITAHVATGTAIKTMLQGTAHSSKALTIVGWGWSCDGTPDGVIELIQTTTVAGGTPTAVTPTKWSDPAGDAALSTWGFSPATEGTVVATTRLLDLQEVKANNYAVWYPLNERPVVLASGVVRVRVDMVTGVNMLCWVCFKES